MRIDTLGQRLTFLRENVLKLNKAQLAEQLGMSDAWLGKVEKDALRRHRSQDRSSNRHHG